MIGLKVEPTAQGRGERSGPDVDPSVNLPSPWRRCPSTCDLCSARQSLIVSTDHLSVPVPSNIATNEALQAIHDAGEGFVFNTFGNKLHTSSCDYVGGMTVNERKWFFSNRADADAVLAERRPGGWTTCPQCLGAGTASPRPVQPAAVRAAARAVEEPADGNESEIRGPDDANRSIEAWSDVYVQYPPASQAQAHLRDELARRLRLLVARDDEVLHAVFNGPKHPQADVENLLTYNIDDSGRCFEAAAHRGIRFEHGSTEVPRSPSGNDRAYSFRYSVDPTAAAFHSWQPIATLVEFDDLAVTAPPAGPRLTDVWLELKRSRIAPGMPSEIDAPVAVMVRASPPAGAQPVVVRQVKAIVDGIVCAFQAHGREATLGEMVVRVARITGTAEDEIRAHLTDRDRAVLGVAKSLLHAWGDVVQWSPSDTRCVAGELLMGAESGQSWELSAKVVALAPAAD